MKGKYSSPSRDSRSESRGKRRKTNLILNLSIGFVLLLIVIVSATIFLGGNNDDTAGNQLEKQTESAQNNKSDQTEKDNQSNEHENADEEKVDSTDSTDSSVENEDNTEQKQESKNQSSEQQNPTPAKEEDAVVTTGGTEENVKKPIENPSWKPIGTSQAGEHTSVYDQNSVDWSEMSQAISYATGIGQDNMTIWFLGNNGHNKSVGTVSAKGQKEKYRVYIEWVDGQGWKPTKVEEINE
ncbi:YrrS family protein [Cytobacillus depressus]|uniref:YrrS family protein n=1 Tax=Cytobacillus depressus TaxID=1602942 RepID=A0A6L3VBW2_9BACI|nr:YrrS family protein [Cytobacillus depressus]KAB2338642.1 YrrS family protein [Cytobacillus depressus]